MKAQESRQKKIYPGIYLTGILLFALSIIAFWPVYFSKLGQVRFTLHLHSILAILWILLLITQSWLAKNLAFSRHKLVGKLTYIVAPLFILFSFILFHDFMNSDTTFSKQLGPRITFYDMSGMLYFTAAYILAVTVYKKKMQIHARLMISTIILMMFPVVSRVFLFYADFGMGPVQILELTIYIVDALVLLLIIMDWRKGKIYPVFPILFAVSIFQHFGFVYSDNWVAWRNFLDWFSSL